MAIPINGNAPVDEQVRVLIQRLSAASAPPRPVRAARAVSGTRSGWRRSKARCAALW